MLLIAGEFMFFHIASFYFLRSFAIAHTCSMHASKLKDIVDQYMEANQRISRLCKTISDSLFVRIDGKKTCTAAELEASQEAHKYETEVQIGHAYKDIISVMKRMFEVFRNDGLDVLQHWRKYTVNIDKMLEDALRVNVKKSLQELSKAVNGDGKSAPTPLFKVSVVLDGTRVQFEPSYDSIVQMTVRLAATVTASLDKLQRLPTQLLRNQPYADIAYRIVIESDEEIKKLRQLIIHGLQSNAPNLQVCHSAFISHLCRHILLLGMISITKFGKPLRRPLLQSMRALIRRSPSLMPTLRATVKWRTMSRRRRPSLPSTLSCWTARCSRSALLTTAMCGRANSPPSYTP
jgi:hypothetical protein